MKIGIDARMFGPKWGGGGLGRYIEELVSGLKSLKTKDQYFVFLKNENFSACKTEGSYVKKVRADVHWYGFAEQFKMPKLIKKQGIDLMHYPHWNVPIFSKVPFIVTIHDLILLDDPSSAHATQHGGIIYAIKRFGYRIALRHAVKKSRAIITVSEFTKEAILKHFSVDPKKITVIHNGVSELSANKVEAHTPKDPYFLYVGSAYPHKNLESLLHAFSFFIKAYPDIKLVFVGKRDAFYDALKKELSEIEIPEDSVIFTGFVSDEELVAYYAGASLYVYPSRLEGFGLPPLEAMKYGAPVASSNAGPLPEVLGDAAWYFDPDDLEQMVEIMERSLKDKKKRDELVKRGEKRAATYSWDDTAKKTFEVYSQTIETLV